MQKYPYPRLISWNVTLKCPLRCSHCYINAGNSEVQDPLSTEEAEKVIDEISSQGRPLLILSGGEPLLRGDIFRIISYGAKKGLRMAIGTSGYTLGRDTAEKLKSSGLSAAAISLDSADPKVHDKFRGVSGAWERAVSAVEYTKSAGINVQINTTVISPDMKNIESVISKGQSLGVSDFQVFFPVSTGRGEQMKNRYNQDYLGLVREILVKYKDSDVNIRPTCIPQFTRILDELGIDNQNYGRGCIAGISYCRIFADGEVTPCPFIPLSAGNLKEKSFSEIWQNSDLFTALRNKKYLTGRCKSCGYAGRCGGCRARAYAGSGHIPLQNGIRTERYSGSDNIMGEDPLCPYD